MRDSDESQWADHDDEGGQDPEADPGEDLEAMIEQADRPFGTESFGTTAEEQEEGESLDRRLREEQPSRTPDNRQLAIEDEDVPDEEDELVGTADLERDPFVSPEEAAMTVRDRAPGAIDHPEEPGTEFDGLEPPEPEESSD
jgi:hypothetical protein